MVRSQSSAGGWGRYLGEADGSHCPQNCTRQDIDLNLSEAGFAGEVSTRENFLEE